MIPSRQRPDKAARRKGYMIKARDPWIEPIYNRTKRSFSRVQCDDYMKPPAPYYCMLPEEKRI